MNAVDWLHACSNLLWPLHCHAEQHRLTHLQRDKIISCIQKLYQLYRLLGYEMFLKAPAPFRPWKLLCSPCGMRLHSLTRWQCTRIEVFHIVNLGLKSDTQKWRRAVKDPRFALRSYSVEDVSKEQKKTCQVCHKVIMTNTLCAECRPSTYQIKTHTAKTILDKDRQLGESGALWDRIFWSPGSW